MKRFVVICLVIASTLTSFAQDQNIVARTQAIEMANALVKKDFPAFLKFMHPDILKYAGGKEKALQKMDTANKMATQLGASIKKILIGTPGKIINYKNQLQATLPQSTEMTTGFGNVTLETTLIAISTDAGKNWYFIDTSIYNMKDVKKALPDLSPELVIPSPKPPKFTPAQP